MNQILYTGKNKSKVDVSVALKIFTTVLIIFAICFLVLGLYLYNATKPEDIGENPVEEPEPEVQSKIDIAFSSITDGVKINIKSNLIIKSVTYRWDDEEENEIPLGENANEVVQNVEIKQGTHTLYVKVVDEAGKEQVAEQPVIGDKEPEVTITTDGVNNFVIKATDDEGLSRIKIVLNGETILEQELNTTQFDYTTEIPQGDSVIEVTAYNLNELVKIKKGKITGFAR